MTTASKPRDILDRVSAYIIFHGATPVASIAIRHPATERGRYLSARVTWGNLPPVEGRESGRYAVGKDAVTRACSDAAHRMPLTLPGDQPIDMQATYSMFVYFLRNELRQYGWAENLRVHNFRAVQAI